MKSATQANRGAYDLSIREWEVVCREMGQPAFRARQVWNWLYVRNVEVWDQMKNLPAPVRAEIGKRVPLAGGDIATISGEPGGARKILVRLIDDEQIEAVLIPAASRLTVCVSSQVGCKFHCAFCASGQGGFTRHLRIGEMVAQVMLAWRVAGAKPSHVVFMGVGEPMDNFDNVIRAVRTINDGEGLNLAARRITISTSGVVPGIEKLAEQGLQVELSVSLHAPNTRLRSELMPVNRQYPLPDLIRACRHYIEKTHRIVTFEYTLIRDVNDRPEHARELARLLLPLGGRVNLIPLSPVPEYPKPPSVRKTMDFFVRTLQDAGINATIRASKGSLVNAACGQLRASHQRPS